jgi:lipopolysaccharide/colanic/teichoic acid biosynthesis glycosyltransferase
MHKLFITSSHPVLFASARVLDILFSGAGLICLSPLLRRGFFLSAVDTKSPLFVQVRLGLNRRPFKIYKLRTMRVGTPSLPTHIVGVGTCSQCGKFLRYSKIDEIPQLWNVFWGDMSIVGPRPCLPTQLEVTAERDARGVVYLKPGITGLAQLIGVDMARPRRLARVDAIMQKNFSVSLYFYVILGTIVSLGRRLVRAYSQRSFN